MNFYGRISDVNGNSTSLRVYFGSNSQVDLMSPSLAKKLGLKLEKLKGGKSKNKNQIQDLVSGDSGLGQSFIAKDVGLELERPDGSWQQILLPVVLVPVSVRAHTTNTTN